MSNDPTYLHVPTEAERNEQLRAEFPHLARPADGEARTLADYELLPELGLSRLPRPFSEEEKAEVLLRELNFNYTLERDPAFARQWLAIRYSSYELARRAAGEGIS